MENKQTDTKDREISISRLLDAPVDIVWEVWIRAVHIANWWAPNGFTNTIGRMEVEPEGQWDLVMHGPDGTDYKNKSIFKEVVPFRKLVYEHVTGPKFTATILFDARGEQTFLSWTMVFESREEFINTVKTYKADEGLKQNIEKLSVFLEKMKLNKPA